MKNGLFFVGRHCRLERRRVRFSASSNRPVPSPMNMMPSAWPNNDRYYTNQRNGAPTKHTPHPNYPVGLSPGVAPWLRPSVPNNWPIPSSMNIMPNAWPHASMCYTDRTKCVPEKLNAHAYNPAGPSRGVEPRPRPFFSNNRPTPPAMNIMPNAWPNANMCYMDQGNGVSAMQNPDAGNPIGPMPGVMPWPQPFISSNTWQTPSPLNVGPNTSPNNNVPDMDRGFQMPAEQNPYPYNNVGPGPIQVQQLSSYPTGLLFTLRFLLMPRHETPRTFFDEHLTHSYLLKACISGKKLLCHFKHTFRHSLGIEYSYSQEFKLPSHWPQSVVL